MSDRRDTLITGGARGPLTVPIAFAPSSPVSTPNGASEGRGAGVSTRSSCGNGESCVSGGRRASMASWMGQSLSVIDRLDPPGSGGQLAGRADQKSSGQLQVVCVERDRRVRPPLRDRAPWSGARHYPPAQSTLADHQQRDARIVAPHLRSPRRPERARRQRDLERGGN